MARQIIILDQQGFPSDATYRYVLWATVPAARVAAYANPAATSALQPVANVPGGITTAELAAIQAGQIVERVGTATFPAGTPAATMATFVIGQWNSFQAQITASNPWGRYGTSWDGTAWTNLGTA